jgi:hypothetical protein
VKAYTLSELLSDLDHGIFKKLEAGKNVDHYRRNLQRTYVNRLLEEIFAPDDSNNLSEMQGILRNTLKEDQKLFKKAMQNPNIDHIIKIHVQEMNERITSRFSDLSKTSKTNAPVPFAQ